MKCRLCCCCCRFGVRPLKNGSLLLKLLFEIIWGCFLCSKCRLQIKIQKKVDIGYGQTFSFRYMLLVCIYIQTSWWIFAFKNQKTPFPSLKKSFIIIQTSFEIIILFALKFSPPQSPLNSYVVKCMVHICVSVRS